MGNRDIWKISRRPSSTSSYQGNMYILIATESARNPVKKARKFDLVLQSLSVSGTCSFCTFLIIKVFESTLLRLPCAPGKFEISWHLPWRRRRWRWSTYQRPSTRSTTTPLVGMPGRPCLRWTSRNVFFVTHRKKKEKLLKPRGTYPLYLGVFPNDSAQRCSNINDARILMRKDDVCSWRSTSWQTFMWRKWCTMPLPSESTPAPSPWTPLPSFNDWARWQLPDMAFKCHTLMIEEWITDAYCIMNRAICMASYCEMKYRKKLSEGTVWRARVTWSKDTLTWDWSFTDLTSVQNRSMCSAVKYSQGQLLRDVRDWTRHKKEKKRKSWRSNGVPDELSRTGELEETRHWSWDVPFSRSSPSPRFQLSPPICLKRKSMYMFQVSCIIFSNG